jgi:hypothetical protein
MSTIQEEVLQKFHEALAAHDDVPDELPEQILKELTAKNGANPERLATIYREAVGDQSA